MKNLPKEFRITCRPWYDCPDRLLLKVDIDMGGQRISKGTILDRDFTESDFEQSWRLLGKFVGNALKDIT